ncbi:uncharacterized protein LOC141655250 [Silene latifolia]|uniref:uncharacterized protein LOC141655250 n=1 Tax=Silene latifolia TaxID=37657 RepID=UPI003D77E4EA
MENMREDQRKAEGEARRRHRELWVQIDILKQQSVTPASMTGEESPAIQNLADGEILTLEGSKKAEVWQMHIDGASNQRGAGVGLILRSPQGDLIAQAVRSEFKATSNETEYEALILGMKLTLELEVRHLRISSDSLLIVNHVNDEFIARDSKMIAYLKIAKELKQKFVTCKLKQIPRDQNVEADSLATLRATFKPTELSSIPIAHMLEPSIQKVDEVDKGELEDSQSGEGVGRF